MSSYLECNARERVARVFDPGSFEEFLPPSLRIVSPHLAQLDAPVSFDDGVIAGRARLDGRVVLGAAQEGGFMGGAVGEVHGAKLVGMLERAVRERVHAVLLLLESGGVRLHEANAGLIAVSEVMRAILEVRSQGIPVVALIGGANGCFGGMGIAARCANAIVMSEEGRLAMSGPEVIETAHGVEEFDSRDRALVWRTTGGKHRYLLGDCQMLVADTIDAFRAAALEAMRSGLPVILLDDFDRENEADLIVAAEKLTVETMALLIRECSGIVCLCLTADRVRELQLPPMAPENGSRYGTPFTVSIEARDGVSTGVSAQDRVTTIRAATRAGAQPSDLVRPGHVFPLRATPGGVLARAGHTEGSVDLAVLAGLQPAAVLCELMNPDGTMMRGEQIEQFAEERAFPILTIAELIQWRRARAL